MKDSTLPILLRNLFELLESQRSIFRQERTFLRALGLLMGELFVFARHTVTQELLALGLTDSDWSAWYRLFSRQRFAAERASECLFAETLRHTDIQEPYVIGVDGVQVARSSLKMPGTSWLKAPHTAAFRPGIHRAQRFVDLSWLVQQVEGFSRAIPLSWLPAFPEKAVLNTHAPSKEWQAGLKGICWVRSQLDAANRQAQQLLVLVDGSFEKAVDFWRGLPERVVVLGRSARNRALYTLPHYCGIGRPPEYGHRVPKPADWLKVRQGWQTAQVRVRGRLLNLPYRIEGPYVRYDLPFQPVFLIVVRGMDRHIADHRIKRDPAFYLVSAIQQNESWILPFPAEMLLSWAWQRWELEVAHRELKSGFGLGDKQCWNEHAAIVSVQWSAWVYALLLLAGYRSWGLLNGPPTPARWWRGSRRWSFNTLWRSYRVALWGTPDFRAVWTATADNWLKKGDWMAALWNSATAAARS
jgi:hypothetical protein